MEPRYGTFHDANTGETIDRELTTEEYEALLASGWTLEPDDAVA